MTSNQKINVLQFICPAGLFGAEMWILALARNLGGHDIHCRLAVSHESDAQNIEIVNRFKALGLPAHKITMRGRFDPGAVGRLADLIRTRNIHIIHTHGYKSDILGLMAAKLTGIKAVSTPHGFENSKDFKLQMFIRMGCFSFKFFDMVAPLSDELLENVRSFGVPAARSLMIQNGVDLDEVEQEAGTGPRVIAVNEDEKRIGYVGQLASRKNVDDILSTFDLLYKEHKQIRLFLVGEGPLRNALEKHAASLNCAGQIEFLGYRPDRLQIVKHLDLFTMTSSLEGIPRCMMEAMGMGVPAAAYNIPGVDKLIIHNQTGLMADFGDIHGLKNCWEKLLFDRPFSKHIAAKGKRHIYERFSAARMAGEYTQLYRKLVN